MSAGEESIDQDHSTPSLKNAYVKEEEGEKEEEEEVLSSHTGCWETEELVARKHPGSKLTSCVRRYWTCYLAANACVCVAAS